VKRVGVHALADTIRVVALFEAAKGALVVLAGFGALTLIHHDVQRFAERLVRHMHLDAASHYPRIFLDAAANVTDARLWLLAAFAATYGLIRFAEAYGLWHGRRWAEWLAAVSGGIYIPFEIFHLLHRTTLMSVGALVLNVFIVGMMLYALLRPRPAEMEHAR
jgi:uncharacterized membrane protein (DUF2068 family)